MQYINHWPDTAQLALHKTVTQDLHHQLLQPFDNVASAKDFWQETFTTVITLDPTDNIAQLKESDDGTNWSSL